MTQRPDDTAQFLVTRRDQAGRKTYFAAHGAPIWTDDPAQAARFLSMDDADATADDFGDYYGLKDAGYHLGAEHQHQDGDNDQ